jgi:hypothetical protein
MPGDHSVPQGRSGAVQAAGNGTVVGSPQCEVCGEHRGGQKVVCSEKSSCDGRIR